MQLTKGYFVISRLVHRLGRAQSYREGGGQEQACRQQEGCGLQPPHNPAIFYPTPHGYPKSPWRLDTGKDTLVIGICGKDITLRVCLHAPPEAPEPLYSFVKRFLDTSQVHNTDLGVLRGCRKADGKVQPERTHPACAKGWVVLSRRLERG